MTAAAEYGRRIRAAAARDRAAIVGRPCPYGCPECDTRHRRAYRAAMRAAFRALDDIDGGRA